MSSPWRLVFRTAVLLLISSALLAQSDSTPLGDVVRAPKPEKRAAKIITNDQIPPRPPEPPSPLDMSSSPSGTMSKAAAGSAKQPVDLLSELKEHESWAVRNLERFQRLRNDNNEEFSARAIEAMIERTKRELKDVRDQLAKLPTSTKAAPSELAKVTEPPNRKPEAPNK